MAISNLSDNNQYYPICPEEKRITRPRVDIRIPNELYDEIQAIAIQYFNAKIHHRSNRPEVTPTILKLIKIGIAHLDTSLPATDKKETDELREAIAQFNTRLTKIVKQLITDG